MHERQIIIIFSYILHYMCYTKTACLITIYESKDDDVQSIAHTHSQSHNHTNIAHRPFEMIECLTVCPVDGSECVYIFIKWKYGSAPRYRAQNKQQFTAQTNLVLSQFLNHEHTLLRYCFSPKNNNLFFFFFILSKYILFERRDQMTTENPLVFVFMFWRKIVVVVVSKKGRHVDTT